MKDRPQVIHTTTTRITTGCGKLYQTKSIPDEEYQETFLRLGKSGGCAAAFLDGIGRLISLAQIPDEIVIKAFRGIRCPSPQWCDGKEVLSCLDGVAKLLEAKHSKASEG